ncbi:MAG: ACP S-malonyltransferase [Gammaproteobacteria bacterium]|jgi:[acyl-carrier-protein] S-malonyltransferase|nr:ACP S-malonyltransferase [Gammaproteobacteria bacterium]MBT6755229.1 ACP S-malonyltransferase [Gammaproteobacteria bacterium]MBT7523412.1 ACP S-malonyltransferase [Gammaproteobacteria bacterium]MBT7814534.1 ACP S-malonyltransferase [Gammaproteobacteria bacterium]
MSLGILFPGQGSQSIGMLKDLKSSYSVVSEIFEEASDLLSCDLWKITKNGPESKINDTEFTQPIMLCSAFSIWKIWEDEGGEMPIFMAGHSFGEYTALCASGSLKFKDAVKLVKKRAECMKNAPEGKMAAIIGIDYQLLKSICEDNALDSVSIANINAPGQIVISGSSKGIKELSDLAITKKAKKVIPIPVSVAAHSSLMFDQAEIFKNFVSKVNFAEPTIPVINNVDVQAEVKEDLIKDALVRQLYSSVRWVETIEYMEQQGVDVLLELGPGKILTSFNKRIDNSIKSLSVSDSNSLDVALESVINI